MAVFIIALDDENKEIYDSICNKYDESNRYEFSPTLFFVTDNLISERVAIKIGLLGGDKILDATGIVIKLDESYAGFAKKGLWDWFRLVRSRLKTIFFLFDPFEQQVDHSNLDQGFAMVGQHLIISGMSAKIHQPRKRALDDPTAW